MWFFFLFFFIWLCFRSVGRTGGYVGGILAFLCCCCRWFCIGWEEKQRRWVYYFVLAVYTMEWNSLRGMDSGACRVGGSGGGVWICGEGCCVCLTCFLLLRFCVSCVSCLVLPPPFFFFIFLFLLFGLEGEHRAHRFPPEWIGLDGTGDGTWSTVLFFFPFPCVFVLFLFFPSHALFFPFLRPPVEDVLSSSTVHCMATRNE